MPLGLGCSMASSCECVLVGVRVPSARCLGGGRCIGGPCSWVLRGRWCVRMARHGICMRGGRGGCRGGGWCEGMGAGMGTGMGRQGGALRRHAQLGTAAGQTASLAQLATSVWRRDIWRARHPKKYGGSGGVVRPI
jgi:hypothetical protein